MNIRTRNGICIVGALAAVVAIALTQAPTAAPGAQPSGAQPAAAQLAASPAVGAKAGIAKVGMQQFTLVSAQRFRTTQPFRHVWRADQPLVTSGWLLVLACDGELLVPVQVRQPVLYVGRQTAERINVGHESGKLVVLVPGDFQLDQAPIFMGPEALPEELVQADIDAALAATDTAPPTSAQVDSVLVAGTLEVANDFELRLRAIDLVEQHSPYEKDLISGWRVPLVK